MSLIKKKEKFNVHSYSMHTLKHHESIFVANLFKYIQDDSIYS